MAGTKKNIQVTFNNHQSQLHVEGKGERVGKASERKGV